MSCVVGVFVCSRFLGNTCALWVHFTWHMQQTKRKNPLKTLCATHQPTQHTTPQAKPPRVTFDLFFRVPHSHFESLVAFFTMGASQVARTFQFYGISFREERQHRHKLFGPDFLRTFLTLTIEFLQVTRTLKLFRELIRLKINYTYTSNSLHLHSWIVRAIIFQSVSGQRHVWDSDVVWLFFFGLAERGP